MKKNGLLPYLNLVVVIDRAGTSLTSAQGPTWATSLRLLLLFFKLFCSYFLRAWPLEQIPALPEPARSKEGPQAFRELDSSNWLVHVSKWAQVIHGSSFDELNWRTVWPFCQFHPTPNILLPQFSPCGNSRNSSLWNFTIGMSWDEINELWGRWLQRHHFQIFLPHPFHHPLPLTHYITQFLLFPLNHTHQMYHQYEFSGGSST